MINAAYALLKNRDGHGLGAQAGSEYVPTDYKTRRLGDGLLAVRRVLFGDNPDETYLNYRLRQYLTILHAGGYADYITNLDPRITYLPFTAGDPLDFGISAVPLDHNTPLTLQGEARADDSSGIAEFTFKVAAKSLAIYGPQGDIYADPDVTEPPLTPDFDTPDVESEPVVYVSGLSSPIALGSTGLFALIPESAPPGATWIVSGSARPKRDLSDVLAQLTQINSASYRELFGAIDQEPYATFRNLWDLNKQLPERLTGILLALAYRTQEAPVR